jgi:hypothetical protein
MNVAGIALILLALSTGMLAAWSTDQWFDAAELGDAEYQKLKNEFLNSADLMRLHNEVYKQVGERVWEEQVKPQFLSDVTWATVRATGNLFPDARDLIDWVRANPEEARRLLKASAGTDQAVSNGSSAR